MINILSTVLSGLVIGILARFFYPGAVEMGWLLTIGLGVAGSLLAGLVTTRGKMNQGFHMAGWIASIIGAMVLIFVARLIGLG
ncbi:GlsB/YeaQ/YmgE family stress response membrane protein [Novosphingobium sp. ZN18A2]|uniref:GlsB/YeaQ/YmgE family stress response membrane protein n=1 Tax=Novosphingobium sp. ZN18A2 TaxID=3079861 RepID=UPI0030D3B374